MSPFNEPAAPIRQQAHLSEPQSLFAPSSIESSVIAAPNDHVTDKVVNGQRGGICFHLEPLPNSLTPENPSALPSRLFFFIRTDKYELREAVPTLLVHGDRKDIQDGTSLDKHVPSVVDLQFQK